MLKIVEYDHEQNYRRLTHEQNVFRKALYNVLRGERRFHVTNPEGEDYDLVYEDNDAFIKKMMHAEQDPFLGRNLLNPPYYFYDENDTEKLLFFIFEKFNRIVFESVNEYSAVLARVLLKNTDKTVVFSDRRIYWFVDAHERLIVKDEFKKDDSSGVMTVYDNLSNNGMVKDSPTEHIRSLFHDVFILQWLTELPMSQIKYVEASVEYSEGIGSLLVNIFRMKAAFSRFGWKLIYKRGGSRYRDEMLETYFDIDTPPADSNEANTVYITSFYPTILSNLVWWQKSVLDEKIFRPAFLAQLREYEKAVFGEKRMLGLLLRGTDYVLANMPFKGLPIEKLISFVQDKMQKENYDGIFLATEDQDYYERMLAAFPGKVRVVAQERFRKSEFKDAKMIAQLERQKKSGAERDASIEDTTINYFYAIYLLSKCEGFISMPECSGTYMTLDFNGGRFNSVDVLKMKAEDIEKEELYRSYENYEVGLENSTIHDYDANMICNISLRETVDAEKLQKAVDIAGNVCPYVFYTPKVNDQERYIAYFPNELPIPVHPLNGNEKYGEDALNKHFISVSYGDHLIRIGISCSLTDDTGCSRYVDALLSAYFGKRTSSYREAAAPDYSIDFIKNDYTREKGK